MNKEQKEFIKSLNGTEFFYSDIGGVLVRDFELIRFGEVIEKITSKNYQEIVDSYHEDEYGTTDIKEILAMEGF